MINKKNRNKIEIRRDILEVMMRRTEPMTKWKIGYLAYCTRQHVEYLIKIGLLMRHNDENHIRYSISMLGIESLKMINAFLSRKQASQSQL